MLTAILCALLSLTQVESQPYLNDPREWGSRGVLAADHSNGQYVPSVQAHSNVTLVAWQDDSGTDPDIAVQAVDTNGNRLLGNQGMRLLRPGIQTNPCVAGNAVVFRESLNGGDWSVAMLRFSAGSFSEHVITEASGGVAELSAVATPDGVVITWIADSNVRAIKTAIVTENEVRTSTLCSHGGNVVDVNVCVNNDVVFWAWTDWRDVMHSHLYAQSYDLANRLWLFTDNGFNVTPEADAASLPRLSRSEPGYVAITYLEREDSGQTSVRFQILDVQMNFRFWPAQVIGGTTGSIRSQSCASLGHNTFIAWSQNDTLCTAIRDFSGQNVGASWAQELSAGRIDDIRAVASPDSAWVVWADDRAGRNNERVYVRVFDDKNLSLWNNDVAVAETSAPQRKPAVTLGKDGGCIVAWLDSRTGNPAVALQKLQ